MTTTRRKAFAAAAGLVLTGLGLSTQRTSANTGTCKNKTYRCKGRQKVICGKGNTVSCQNRKGQYVGAATQI